MRWDFVLILTKSHGSELLKNMSRPLISCGGGLVLIMPSISSGPHRLSSLNLFSLEPGEFSEPSQIHFYFLKWCFFRWRSPFDKSQSIKLAGTNPVLAQELSCVECIRHSHISQRSGPCVARSHMSSKFATSLDKNPTHWSKHGRGARYSMYLKGAQ